MPDSKLMKPIFRRFSPLFFREPWFSRAVFVMLAFGSIGVSPLSAKVPDLTAGEATPFGEIWFNLGPTGVQAWVYRGPEGGKRVRPKVDTSKSRQILVQTIEKGSPADGVLKVGDVILGANGKGATPTKFTSDARITFGNAIGDAEARDPATLKMMVWRAGKAESLTMTLRTMGAYSDTAPYDCPKSAKILEEGLDYTMAKEDGGRYGLSTLALLAANDPKNPKNTERQKKAQEYAYSLLLPQNLIDSIKIGNVEPAASMAWDRGLRLIVLAEYYLQTKDPKVFPSVEAIALSIAHGQGANGAVGHRFQYSAYEGVYNDAFTIGYTMNASTLPTALGLVLAKKCEVTLPELDAAIERVVPTLSATAGIGSFSYYVEGLPLAYNNEDNGKTGLGALCFAMQDDRKEEARYFGKLATGSTIDRGHGHIINYAGYIWTPLGANVGGKQAMASYFSNIKSELDLNRHWDGGFEYERYNRRSDKPSMGIRGFWMSTAALLTYAIPLKQLEITGRSYSKVSELVLTKDEIDEAVLSDWYDAKKRTTDELLKDLKSEIPRLSSKAAMELAARPEEAAALASKFIEELKTAKYTELKGLCRVLGELKSVEAIPSLIELLSHKTFIIRFLAAEALTKVPKDSLQVHVPLLLKIVAANARPIYPLDPNDPQQLANAMLCKVLLGKHGIWGVLNDVYKDTDKELIYPALRAWTNHPQASTRNKVYKLYKLLTPEEVTMLSGMLIKGASESGLTGAAAGPGNEIIKLFQSMGIAEGVPLIKTHIINQRFKKIEETLGLLEKYGASATTVKPDPKMAEFMDSMLVGHNNSVIVPAMKEQITRIRDMLLSADKPTVLKPLKKLESVKASSPVLKLPNNQAKLSATVTDIAGSELIYSWRKVHGPGKVSFSENGTTGSSSTTIKVEEVPGRYLFEVTAVDPLNLTEVTGTVAVEMQNSKGVLPSNKPPLAKGQSIKASQAIPTAVKLSAEDPEGYPLVYQIISPPSHGTLKGAGPDFTYLSGFQFIGSDKFIYMAMDSDGQMSAPTTVKIEVKKRTDPVGLALYEPMDYKAGGKMKTASGASEIGFAGPWNMHFRTKVSSQNLSFGGIPSKGLSTWPHWGGSRGIAPSALLKNGLLEDGAELWLSFLVQNGNGGMTLNLVLANKGLDQKTKRIADNPEQPYQGVGVSIGGGTKATLFKSTPGADSGWGNRNGIKKGETGIIIAKMKWGKDLDVVKVYVPKVDMILPKPLSILRTKVDQSAFDTLIITGSIGIDEIRMGPTLHSVLLGTVPMSRE